MKKQHFFLSLFSVILLASCSVQNQMITDASYSSIKEINCESEREEIYVFYETPNFVFEELGQMTITSQSSDQSYLASSEEKISMINMAKYVAWLNCADGLINVIYYEDSLTAMAITINKTPTFKNTYANNLETGFVEYVNQETKNNEKYNTENVEWSPELTDFLLGATILIFSLFFYQ